MDIKTLWGKAADAYADLVNDKVLFDSYCEELGARLTLKKGDIKKLIEAEAISDETGRVRLQLDLFENPPLPKNVRDLNKKSGVSA